MDVRRRRRFFIYALLIVLLAVALPIRRQLSQQGKSALAAGSAFLVEPYVQWGSAPREAGEMAVLWQAVNRDADWVVEVKTSASTPWMPAEAPVAVRYDVKPVEPRRLYRAKIAGLVPGAEFAYRVRRGGVPVFEATALAPKKAGQSHRFAAFGDGGADSSRPGLLQGENVRIYRQVLPNL
jgi:hypothetical protein